MSYIMYINLSIINTAQIQRNNEAKNLLRQYGIIEEKTINCGAKTSIILDLKNRFGKLEYPLIEIDKKPIGCIKNLELYLKTNKINNLIKNAEYHNNEDPGEDSKDENDYFEKIQENNIEEIYSIILKSEEVLKKEKQIKEIIQQKRELLEKTSDKEKTEVSGVLSYPLHLLETTYKSTINGIYSYFKDSEKTENNDDFFEIPVLKTNWYGRVQKRVLKFYCDRIERIDSQKRICQVYPFHQISKIFFTEKLFFHLLTHNGTEDYYQISPFYLAPVLDLFRSINFVNSDFVLQFEDLTESTDKVSGSDKFAVVENLFVLPELPLPREDEKDI